MVSAAELYDHDAEEAIICVGLMSSDAFRRSREVLVAEDFHAPAHGHIWHAMCELADAHERIDTITVADRLTGLVPRERVSEILANTTPSISGSAKYTGIIVDYAARRRLLHVASSLSSAAVETNAEDALERAEALLAGVEIPTVVGPPSPTIDEFGSDDLGYDWLVPGLLERGDRLLITGGEGSGKSTLLRQIAVQLAGGVHPFRLTDIDPCNVTFVDLENGPRLLKRELAGIRRRSGIALEPERLRIESKPAGMDITSRAARAWIKSRIVANQTDVMCIGPIYKLMPGSDQRTDGAGGEAAAMRVARALDAVRDMGVTLIMETHAPHGNGFGRDMRPFGSSVWLRWPEFGYGIRKDPDVKGRFVWDGFRGDRDGPRDWPTYLMSSRHSGTPSRWPWTAQFDRDARAWDGAA